jgi:hypothetical protein
MSPRSKKVTMNFNTMSQENVPQGRNGKRKQIVTSILSDLNQLKEGRCPLRCHWLNWQKARKGFVQRCRATRKASRNVATAATDANYLYVWNQNR